jgi:hypothetical protein
VQVGGFDVADHPGCSTFSVAARMPFVNSYSDAGTCRMTNRFISGSGKEVGRASTVKESRGDQYEI